MWPKLVAEAKDGGADCIETYVFWNGHEIAPGQVRRPLHNRMLFCSYFILLKNGVFFSICLVNEFRWIAVLLRGPVRPGAVREGR